MRKTILSILFFLTFLMLISLNKFISYGFEPPSPSKPHDSIYILIDLAEQRLYLMEENNKILKSYPVAIGKTSTPSPVGIWKITNKAKWSGGFGTRWLGLDVPWGKYGIHGTNHPNSIGYEASHGCIRMFNSDIEDLYPRVKVGTTIILYAGPNGAFYKGFRTLKP